MPAIPRHDPNLTEADVLAIQAAIAESPDVDQRIIYAKLEADGTARVRTGGTGGPLGGCGNNVTLRRVEKKWQVTAVSYWRS